MSNDHLLSRSLSYRVALLTLFAISAAQAVSFNAPNPSTAHSLPSSVAIEGGNCSGATVVNPTGAVTNGGQGLALSATASMSSEFSTCQMEISWQGTGSGTLGSTITITPNFRLTVPAAVARDCTLAVSINGSIASERRSA